jgi:acyl-coenzyme A synthetase/AMP-(fatty) acid ligase
LSDRFPEAVALPVPGLEAWLVDEKGNRLADQGSQGELVVKAPFVSAGYWNKPEETAAKFSHTSDGDSILHTGDIFRTDQHGYFYFVSRKDDIIKSRGEKVPPRLVEDLLTELPQVLEVAVIGLPDPILGEAVSAYIVLRSDHALSEQEVRAYCSRHLENFMCPKFINFVTDLPKTHSGKIARRELKDRVLSGLKGEAA